MDSQQITLTYNSAENGIHFSAVSYAPMISFDVHRLIYTSTVIDLCLLQEASSISW